MAEKGVIVEFDFAVMDGSRLLYDTTVGFLRDLDGIGLDVRSEARYLQGNELQAGLQKLFAAVKTKKTAAKASRDLHEAYMAALAAAMPATLGSAFRNFVRILSENGVRVVIATRADVQSETVRAAFSDMLGEKVALYQEPSAFYGTMPWQSWRLAAARNRLSRGSALAITGSGDGVRTALLAGMGALAVESDRVAHHDFGGADAVVRALDSAAAKKVLMLLRVGTAK